MKLLLVDTWKFYCLKIKNKEAKQTMNINPPLPPTPPLARIIRWDSSCVEFCPYCGSSIVRYGFLWRKRKCLQAECKYNKCNYLGEWKLTLIRDSSGNNRSWIYQCPQCEATAKSNKGHFKK